MLHSDGAVRPQAGRGRARGARAEYRVARQYHFADPRRELGRPAGGPLGAPYDVVWHTSDTARSIDGARILQIPQVCLRRCAATSLRDLDQSHGIDQAIGQYEVAIPRDRGVAHDVAATRNGPALEFL